MNVPHSHQRTIAISSDDVEHRTHEHDRLMIINDALVERNLQLRELLDTQRTVLDALQRFVVAVSHALVTSRRSLAPDPRRIVSRKHLAGLTKRQQEILAMVVAGLPSKRIALILGISRRTVENHRASIMTKTGASSLPELTQLTLMAGDDG